MGLQMQFDLSLFNVRPHKQNSFPPIGDRESVPLSDPTLRNIGGYVCQSSYKTDASAYEIHKNDRTLCHFYGVGC